MRLRPIKKRLILLHFIFSETILSFHFSRRIPWMVLAVHVFGYVFLFFFFFFLYPDDSINYSKPGGKDETFFFYIYSNETPEYMRPWCVFRGKNWKREVSKLLINYTWNFAFHLHLFLSQRCVCVGVWICNKRKIILIK